MNLDDMSIAVRERSLPELYDLTVLVVRRHITDIALLTLLLGAPLTGLNWLLLRTDSDQGNWYLLALLLSAEAPIYAAVITAYLGQAMFSREPSKRRALADASRRWLAVVGCALLRFLLTLFPLLLLLYPAHLVEVLVLERQRGGTAWKRAWSLASFYRGEDLLHLVLNLAVGVVAVFLILGGCIELVSVLQLGLADTIDRAQLIHPGRPWLLAACCPAMAFCAALRFCSYLDLRTKREGWEVELEMRRAGQALREGRS